MLSSMDRGEGESASRSGAVTATVAGLSALVASALMTLTGATMSAYDAAWRLPWGALGTAYFVTAIALGRRARWARGFGLGLGLWGIALNLEALIMLSSFGYPAEPMTLGAKAFFGAGLAASSLLTLATAAARADGQPRRVLTSLVFAAASVPCALVYGLAPQASWLVSAAVLAAASLVAAGSTGIARGKTWGLFASIAGAASLAGTLPFTRELGWLHGPHPFLPTGNPLALHWLGMGAVGLASLSVVPFVGPVLAFLLGKAPATSTAVRVAEAQSAVRIADGSRHDEDPGALVEHEAEDTDNATLRRARR
jgi:hypothetical protein